MLAKSTCCCSSSTPNIRLIHHRWVETVFSILVQMDVYRGVRREYLLLNLTQLVNCRLPRYLPSFEPQCPHPPFLFFSLTPLYLSLPPPFSPSLLPSPPLPSPLPPPPLSYPSVSPLSPPLSPLPFPLPLSLPLPLLPFHQVTFTGGTSPCHPHVYSNGHICLSILDKDWSPAMSVISVCLSIQSMLSTCTVKVHDIVSLVMTHVVVQVCDVCVPLFVWVEITLSIYTVCYICTCYVRDV